MNGGECSETKDADLIIDMFAKVNVDLAKSIEGRLTELNKGK